MLKKTCLSVILILSLMLSASAAFAGLAALSYTDTNGTSVTVGPAQQFINPTGAISLYLSAGLERKVGYVLLDGSGATVAEGVSAGIITAADTLTVLGQTYYGKVLTIPNTLAEGNYTLKAQILDGKGQLVSEDSASPFTVNVTPPTAGDLWWNQSAYHQGSITVPNTNGYKGYSDGLVVGSMECSNILVKGVSATAGIDHIQFESFNPSDGSVYYSVAAWYDASTQTGGIGTGSNWSVAQGVHLPNMSGPLGIRFIIYDKAGNKTVDQATVKYNGNYDPAPELVAIYNPNVTTDTQFLPGSGLIGYVPYTPGMATYANPIQLLYRVPKTHWAEYNPDYGLWAAGGTKVYTDAQYVYVRFVGSYSPEGMMPIGYYQFVTDTNWCTHPIYYNLVLAVSASKSPVFISWQYYRSDTGWSGLTSGDLWAQFNTQISIPKIRAVVEPRDYDQVFVEPGTGSTCTIPAGQTECTADVNFASAASGTIKLFHSYCYVKKPDGSLISAIKHTALEWDLMPPSITSYTLDSGSKTATFMANEPYTGGFWGAITLRYGWIIAHNTVTNQDVRVNGVVQSKSGDIHQVTVNYGSLPEGEWQFTLWAQDAFGNTASLSAEALTLDQTPPQIGVYKEAEALADHGSVVSLSQVRITLSDAVDVKPELTSVRLTAGPQGVNVTLATRVQDGAYLLEYPVMFPSMGQEYILVVQAKDASGNVATKTVPFTYDPPQITIITPGLETLNLPAIPASVVHPNGTNALVSGTITIDGVPLSGTYDLIVMSGSTSTTTIAMPGLSLAPGEQKILPAHDFGVSSGCLNMPVRADEPGRVDLLITSTAPNFPVITAKLNFWRPEVQLSADPGWAIQPVIQKQRIIMTKGAGTPCRLTADAYDASMADPVNEPACLVVWTGLPANYQGTANYAEGVLPATGDYTPGYEIYVFNNGEQYLMASGSGQALERAPIQDLAFAVETTPVAANFNRKVQDVIVKLQPSGSYRCSAVTVTQAEAQAKGANQEVCLVRWVTVPDGMQAGMSMSGDISQLSGNFNQVGDQVVAWAVDLYSPYGTVENATTGSATLAVVNPPLPDLAFEPGLYGKKIDDSLYITSSLQGGEVGSVKFGTALLNTNMTLELDGTDEGHTSRQYVSSNDITFNRNLKTGHLAVWESRQVTMKLYYTNLPDVTVAKQITVVGVPSERIRAILTTSSNKSLNTTGVPVKLAVGIPGPHDTIASNELTDGVWRARFGYLNLKNEFHATTDYQVLTNGVLETTLTGFEVGFQKLQAQVEVTPPESASFYSRSLKSNNIYSTVLKGTAPEGQIWSRTLTGPAPLSSVMSLQVDSDSRSIMGAVLWQLSADDGATWQDLATKSPYAVTVKVNAGTYVVRAKMTNAISGAVGYSEGVRLIAFLVPKLDVSAPAAVLVGTPITLKAQVTLDDQPVAAGDAVVSWYNRIGKKVFTGANLEITPADTASLLYTVKARMVTAPEADASAWVRSNVYVRVVPPRPPSGLLVVPSYMEYNLVAAKTYAVVAKLYLAMGLDPAMYPVRGEWHLPDGSVVEGPELAYSPTAKDAAKRQALLEYVAWVDGFKEVTLATFRRSVTVGTYDWPEFRVDVKTYPAVAPSLVTLTATPQSGSFSDLEKPTYVWQFPASAQVVREVDSGRIMQVNFPESGSFEVGVTVTDARGSTAQVVGTVALGEPDPFLVEFAPLFSNSLHRELLNMTLRANVTGGHPQDRLSTYVYTINSPDAKVTNITGIGIIKGLRAGEYIAHLRAVSQQGKVVESDYPLSVIPNQLPICEVTTWDVGDYRWWKAACQDLDGKVAGIRWYQDAKVISSGLTIRVKKSDLTGTWRFEAADDAGGMYRETLNAPTP